jgi:hypothetical protein
MANISLHVRKIKKLPNGEYNVQVEIVNSQDEDREERSSNSVLESVTLSAGTKGIERLEDPMFVEEGAHAWFTSRLGKWDKVNIQKYLEHLLKKKH